MQILAGRDKVLASYTVQDDTRGEFMLHELVSGAFQFGSGPYAKVITSLDQVRMMPAVVQARVQAWLEGGGAQAALRDKVSLDLQDRARSVGPGALEARLAVLERAEPGFAGELLGILDRALEARGLIAAPTDRGTDLPPAPERRLPLLRPEEAAVRHRGEPRTAGDMTPQEEARILAKSGLPVNPNRRVFDPSVIWGDTAPEDLADAPETSPDLEQVRNGVALDEVAAEPRALSAVAEEAPAPPAGEGGAPALARPRLRRKLKV